MDDKNVFEKLDSWLGHNFEFLCTIIYRIIRLIITVIINVAKFFMGLMGKEFGKGI